jgi:hypothetical protein
MISSTRPRRITACTTSRTRIRTAVVTDHRAMARALTGDSPVLLLRHGAADLYRNRSADLLATFDAVLGATPDGEWWAFGVNHPAAVSALPEMLRDWRASGAVALAALRLDLRIAMLPAAPPPTTPAMTDARPATA